ncbi:MAG TPA: GNAT family N-acetyltransferase [Pyrinomonadaceae bacterium]|nr:GNAT family N-acetyltransferase [Pyrinomonadaceae bacterium]
MTTKLPTIEAERICLRGIEESDLEQLHAIFSDPKVMRYWSTLPLESIEEARTLLKEIQTGNQQRTMLKWGVALKTTDIMIGTVTLFHQEQSQGRAEIGYAQARAYWGHGYIHEALQSLLTYAFEEMKLRRVEADVDPRNGASIKTLERLGFQKEGFLRERWHVGGEIQDALFYGLLEREWLRPTRKFTTWEAGTVW